jgi:hypothetical protein
MPTQHSRVRKILIFPMIARDELNRFLESASPSDSHVYFEGTALSLGRGDADRSRPSLVAEDRRVIPSDSEHQINLGGTRRAMLPFCSV